MDYLAIGRLNNMAVYAKILLQGLDRGGEMFIVIPHAVLNPLRTAIDRRLSAQRFVIWSKITCSIGIRSTESPAAPSS